VSNPNKARGTAWESAVVTYLRTALECCDGTADDVRRQVQMGRHDIGDIHAAPFALEAKNEKTITLASYVDQAEREAKNAGLPYGAAVVKRRGKGVASGYVVLSLATFAAVLGELREKCANTPASPER